MKYLLVIVSFGLLTSPSFADPWKDESGKRRWGYDRGPYRAYNYDREYTQEYRRGPCKIERKWGKHGEYKEETKCKGYRD